MAQLVASMSGVVLGGVAEVVGSILFMSELLKQDFFLIFVTF